MTSIKDYYNMNMFNTEDLTVWDVFIKRYGNVVGCFDRLEKPYPSEYFRVCKNPVFVYPDFRHTIYTLNAIRHFMDMGVSVDRMVKDMLWEIIVYACSDLGEDKYIEEFLDVLNYIDYKETNVSMQTIMETCQRDASNDLEHARTFNRVLSLSEQRHMTTLINYANYIDLSELEEDD